MSKRRLYSETFYLKVVDTTVEYLKGRVVKPGELLYVTFCNIEDETTAPDTLGFGKWEHDKFTPLEESETPTAGIRYHLEKTHHFIAGEIPAFRVEAGDTDDIIRGYAEGYYEKVD